MQNIWILNHYAITPDMPGGTRHYDFAKELTKRGYSVTIFASSFHYSQRKELKLSKNQKYKIENIDGINFVWIKTFPYKKNNWRRIINMISYMCKAYVLGRKITKLNKKIQKPDIVIGSSPHLLTPLAAYLLSIRHKTKFVMEVRDLWPQVLIDMNKLKKNSLAIKILQYLEKFLYEKAKRIIVSLPNAGEYITALGIRKNKIIWISNGTDLTRLKATMKSNDKYFKAVYLGAHGIPNALHIILDAAKIIQNKEYKNIKIILIGNGTEKNKLIKYANKLDLGNIEFKKPLAKNLIFKVMNEAEILIFTMKKLSVTKYGISPNKLSDYMSSAKPIVSSAITPDNIVKKTGCGIHISPDNPGQMAEAIIKLYDMSPTEREKMGQRGRKYVEKHHSIPLLVDKLEKIFN